MGRKGKAVATITMRILIIVLGWIVKDPSWTGMNGMHLIKWKGAR